MLLNDLYTIEEMQGTRAVLLLNPAHPIFMGHFPGRPVVPGACQLQLVQELLSQLLGKEYKLIEGGQLKFLTPIDPRHHSRIEAMLKYAGDPLQVTATLSAEGTIFLKLTGIFQEG